MKKLNFTIFKGITEKDKKILTLFYKILKDKFNIQNSSSWDMFEYIVDKIGLDTIPGIIIIKYIYALKFNLRYILDDYNWPPSIDIESLVDDENILRIIFDSYLSHLLSDDEEETLKLLKNCFNEKILYRFTSSDNVPHELVFTKSNTIKINKVYNFYIQIFKLSSFNEEEDFFSSLTVDFTYASKDAMRVRLRMSSSGVEETFLIPTIVDFENPPKKEDLLKILCEDLLSHYQELIIKTLQRR